MRLKTLNGAPLCERLDFSGGSLLSAEELLDRFAHFLSAEPSPMPFEHESTRELKWRRLAPRGTRLRTGWSQPYLPGAAFHGTHPSISFSVSGVQYSFPPDADSTFLEHTYIDESLPEVDNFLQHSLILHDTLLSSQIAQGAGPDASISSSSFLSTSFETSTSEMSSFIQGEGNTLALQVPSALTVTPLESLPSTKHLKSIYPQTPTPNLLCVLVTPLERREVFIQRRACTMTLYEINVADETRSAFKISFWIRPVKERVRNHKDPQESICNILESIEVGDILLLRNIALSTFRDDVYGQSLNPAISRARTTVHVLRQKGRVSIANLAALPIAIVDRFGKVKRWANRHVAPQRDKSRKRKGGTKKGGGSAKRPDLGDDTLPPDTLEAV